MTTEIESLQNFADTLGMTVLKYVNRNNPKRKSDLYYLMLNGRTISGAMDYENTNHFLMGWSKCLKYNTITAE